jgi:dihydrolipoamide dehydrogenase
MSGFDFDLLVIGAGPGGYVAAIRGAQLGLRTACVDSRATLGGTCLNVGCIPSKSLLHNSHLYHEARSGALAAAGIKTGEVSLDLAALHAQREAAVKGLTGGIEFLFKKNKVEWIKGHAEFTGPDQVRAGSRTIRARNVVIATGSSPAPLKTVPVDQKVVVDSTGALELPKVPDHLVVIGGGVIGLELGSVWRRLGSAVTVIEYLDQILPGMDEDVRRESAGYFVKQGLELRTSTKVVGLSRAKQGVTLQLEPAAGGPASTLDADVVLVATGRRAHTDGLGLDKAGIALAKDGTVPVDGNFRTSAPGIWAIGDVIGGLMLAHKAEDEGVAVAELIAGQPGGVNHDIIPKVVYTYPEIAGVGLTEQEAKERGEVRIGKFAMTANSRARANGDTEGFVKIIADAKTDRVLGVWMVASCAATMIAQAAQAMEFGATSVDIAYTCHAHPTHSEAVKEAALAVRGKAIHS